MPATPIRYLTEADVLALLPSIEVQIGLVEGALRAVATGTAHQPPKVPLNLGAGAPFAHAMPAAIDLAQAGSLGRSGSAAEAPQASAEWCSWNARRRADSAASLPPAS